MTIHVLFFGSLASVLGTRSCDIELPDNTTVGDALKHLIERYPALGARAANLAAAVNHAYVTWDQVLHHGDELALIPPVSGG